MRNTQTKYANNLKEYRIKSGLKQKDVAHQLGCESESRICRWERGQSFPNVPNLLKLAKIYAVTPSDLYPDM